jgi:hypothetical protein
MERIDTKRATVSNQHIIPKMPLLSITDVEEDIPKTSYSKGLLRTGLSQKL